ncbi:unnamed protein product [Aureobasidium pullulans]|nr:unnamed protein product [Aureobasidium pullulans]
MSSFCYSITRPYPYKWFTPVAVVGGIVLAALFSFINFYSNAYNMITITTNNPDIVEANRWSHIPGSLTSRIHPKCEDAIIPVGSTFNTNQTALSYQLVSLRNHPALSYHNRRLAFCEVTQILIDFQTSDDRQAALIDRSSWGVTVSADITCNAPNEEHEFNFITNNTWPNIWSPANRLAKAMYSVIQVDLGQTDTIITTFDGAPTDTSILTTADRLHHWTENLTQIWDRSTVADKDNLIPYGWMQMRQFDKITDATDPRWPLQFTPSGGLDVV